MVVSRMLHAKQPNELGTLNGSDVAVEKIGHGFVEMAFPVARGGQRCLAFDGQRMLLGEGGKTEGIGGDAEGVRKHPDD